LHREAQIATQRSNQQVVTDGVMIQHAIGSIFGGKDGGKLFRDLLKRLSDDGNDTQGSRVTDNGE
jgi:hypothetical protein